MRPRSIALIEVTSRSLRIERRAPGSNRPWIDHSDKALQPIRVKAIIATIRGLRLPVTLDDGQFGELWITVYDSPEVPGIEPRVLGIFNQRNLGVGREATMGNVLSDAWALLHDKIAGTPENLRLLEFYGLPKPRERSSYAY